MTRSGRRQSPVSARENRCFCPLTSIRKHSRFSRKFWSLIHARVWSVTISPSPEKTGSVSWSSGVNAFIKTGQIFVVLMPMNSKEFSASLEDGNHTGAMPRENSVIRDTVYSAPLSKNLEKRSNSRRAIYQGEYLT